MTGAASAATCGSAPGSDSAHRAGPGESDSAALMNLLVEGVEAGADIGRLGLLELRLALSSLQRMLLVALLLMPLALLAWVALSLLPAVSVYQLTASLLLGAVAFLAVQLLAMGALLLLWSHYRRTLALPRTRRQFDLLLSGNMSGPEDTGK